MSISSVSHSPPVSLPQAQTSPLKPRDPDHDGDVDKAGVPDTEKSSATSLLKIKV